MTRMIAAVALLGLVHCAPADTPSAAGARVAEARSIGPRDCIRLDAVSARQAIDERTIRFEMLGGQIYHNRLPGRCPGLRQSAQGFGVLSFEVHSNQLCRRDQVRVIDPSAASAGAGQQLSIPCLLGRFTPVEEGDRTRGL